MAMSLPLFLRQLYMLLWKNAIILRKHPWVNLFKCFVLPVGYALWLSKVPGMLGDSNSLGIGSPAPVASFAEQLNGPLSVHWYDNTNGLGSISPDDIMTRAMHGFSDRQRAQVHKAHTPQDIVKACEPAVNEHSKCLAAVIFDAPSYDNTTVQYTLQVDASVRKVDVRGHTGTRETGIFPVQFAIDQAVIELKTGKTVSTPREWQFTSVSNSDSEDENRILVVSALSGISGILFLLTFMGVVYQLAGSFAIERSEQLAGHLKAMGLMDSVRILSWIVSAVLANLPAWITVTFIWSSRMFTATNTSLLLAVHVVYGVSLASWCLFVAVPFGYRSPHLAAVIVTLGGIARAINASVKTDAISTTQTAFRYTLMYPPSFYVFALRIISGFEMNGLPTQYGEEDPQSELVLLPLMWAAMINVVVWPILAVGLERIIYGARKPWRWTWFKRHGVVLDHVVPEGVAISIRNLNKTFKTSIWKSPVTAVADLTLDIPSRGIFVLLGSNGAGKSTTLSILGGLAGHNGGSIKFAGDVDRPARGTIGIVPQTNILFPELSCLQTLRVWQAVKWSTSSKRDEDLEQLLVDCDLERKIHAQSGTLSGGQKRKLQLAIGIVANSSILLVDECTSGVDPLSRRALWKTLNALRHDRTIVFTTHFLDEADLLSDRIAILMDQGKLVANDSPVALKTQHGEFTVEVQFDWTGDHISQATPLLYHMRTSEPKWTISESASHRALYHLKDNNVQSVSRALQLIESEKARYGITSYDVHGTTIEKIFVDLIGKEKSSEETASSVRMNRAALHLDDGRPQSPFSQALVIFYKRALVARKGWLTFLLMLAVGIIGASMATRLLFDTMEKCPLPGDPPRQPVSLPLYLPELYLVKYSRSYPMMAPPSISSMLGPSTSRMRTINVEDEHAFVEAVTKNYMNMEIGGLSVDLDTSETLFAWNAFTIAGASLLNFANNLQYNAALDASEPSFIMATLSHFAAAIPGNFISLFWAFGLCCAMAIFPAFFALYVSHERRSSVQAMQLSNGLRRSGLWLGHLMFDGFTGLIIAVGVHHWALRDVPQIGGASYLTFTIFVYAIASALFSYCVSVVMKSPLASFGVVAVVNFATGSAALVSVFSAAKGSSGGLWGAFGTIVTTLCPVGPMMRSILVSGNIMFLLCDDYPMMAWGKFGGPIIHLVLLAAVFLALLIWADSGSIFSAKKPKNDDGSNSRPDSSALLYVKRISKTFGETNVLDDVSWETGKDQTFVLLGPNGAGKTTSLNIIRGDVLPDEGDVFVGGASVVKSPHLVRARLGVCPQFSAIDSQLTVRQHLDVYGRLKGLRYRRGELKRNIDAIMDAVGLAEYADRLAVELSGGNQRKLSLAIALLGNPAVVLIGEYSTGLDAKMKRDMWETLRSVSAGKAIVITTHSLEEASALATRVGILAKRMLVMGAPASLQKGGYEVHFSCRTLEDRERAHMVMKGVPGARLAEDVATRFEVPLDGSRLNLARLFQILTEKECGEYTIERATLESVFLKVIRENNVREDDLELSKPARRWGRFNLW